MPILRKKWQLGGGCRPSGCTSWPGAGPYPAPGQLDQLRPVESSEARPAARAQLGAGTLASLFFDGWGPAWRFAAAAGLPPHGPLTLPGAWKIS